MEIITLVYTGKCSVINTTFSKFQWVVVIICTSSMIFSEFGRSYAKFHKISPKFENFYLYRVSVIVTPPPPPLRKG